MRRISAGDPLGAVGEAINVGIIALGSHSTQPKTASEASAVSQLSHFTSSYSDRRPPAATSAAKSRP